MLVLPGSTSVSNLIPLAEPVARTRRCLTRLCWLFVVSASVATVFHSHCTDVQPAMLTSNSHWFTDATRRPIEARLLPSIAMPRIAQESMPPLR